MNLSSDEMYEEDIATVDAAVAVLRATLEREGLWETGDDEGRIRVTAYSRSGYPINADSSR